MLPLITGVRGSRTKKRRTPTINKGDSVGKQNGAGNDEYDPFALPECIAEGICMREPKGNKGNITYMRRIIKEDADMYAK